MKNKIFNMINKIKLLCHSELDSETFIKKSKPAFTLAEVLLATAIVGIIAGLVLPVTISKAQNRGFDQAYERNVQAVADAVNSLIVLENKDFFKTEMYKDEAPSDYEDTSGTFIKKYMKVSKYCGSGDDAKNCFADKYYQYNGNKKEVYEPNYTGACAILKNGASICLIPQIGATGPKGIIDLNGKKGPNVYGRDLNEFILTAKPRIGMDKTQDDRVYVTFAPELGMGKTACEKDPQGDDCCKTKSDIKKGDACCFNPNYHTEACDDSTPPDPCEAEGLACCQSKTITSPSDPCCAYPEIQNKENSKCLIKVTVDLTCDTVYKAPEGTRADNSYTNEELAYVAYMLEFPKNITLKSGTEIQVDMEWTETLKPSNTSLKRQGTWKFNIIDGKIVRKYNGVGFFEIQNSKGKYIAGQDYILKNHTVGLDRCSLSGWMDTYDSYPGGEPGQDRAWVKVPAIPNQ